MNPVLKRSITALTTAAAVVLAIVYAPSNWFVPAFAVLAALAILEYWQLLGRKLRPCTVGGALAFFGGAAFLAAALSVLPVVAAKWSNLVMLYLIAVIKISDMGGFAFGLGSQKLFGGNHKLCPSISPGKSWEGLAGSVTGSVLLSLAFLPITHFGAGKAVLFGVVAALVGTAGDLVESKFKRWVGVKDSSTMKLTNGMGGVLDMLDSLLLAPAALAAMI